MLQTHFVVPNTPHHDRCEHIVDRQFILSCMCTFQLTAQIALYSFLLSGLDIVPLSSSWPAQHQAHCAADVKTVQAKSQMWKEQVTNGGATSWLAEGESIHQEYYVLHKHSVVPISPRHR